MKKSVFIILCSALPMLMMAQNTTVKDCQGHVYPVVKIGNQYWMAENLQCTKYDTQSEMAGKTIIEIDDETDDPYYIDCRNVETDYSDNLTNAQRGKLGLVYNWNAVMGYTGTAASKQTGMYSGKRQGICPNGWHVPNNSEWNTLANNCGGASVAGTKLKSSTGWCYGGNTGTNDFGFSALPAGYAAWANLGGVGSGCFFWSADAKDTDMAYVYVLHYKSTKLGVDYNYKNDARSVRCLRD
ncbi:MAG: hypothetical protein MJ007_03200 [Paludibacteraceae bacterium]|nr:hypothetical protein [Paludibacteraceae bacterium]